MSILLEALKKSEERRQLGKTPDIHDPVDHRPEAERKPGFTWLPVVLVGAAMAAIFWLVWNQYRAPEMAAVGPEPAVSQRTEADTPPASSKGETRMPGSAAAVRTAPPSSAARTPVESFTANESGEGEEDRSGQDPEAERKQQLAENFNNFRQPEPVESAEEDARAGLSVPAQPATRPPPNPAPNPGPARSAQAEPSATGSRDSEPVSYWELPQNVRDGMPEFQISVLVYAEKPADRFMLLNGRRVVEKDSVSGVVLEEIRREGAVFRYRNYRFLVRN
jgi:general secretion pathway protein B